MMKMAFPLHSLGLREVNFEEKMRRENEECERVEKFKRKIFRL
jgi:hypothetical protein